MSHIRRVGTGFTILPSLLDELDAMRGNTPRSRIIEALIKLYIQNPAVVKQVLEK